MANKSIIHSFTLDLETTEILETLARETRVPKSRIIRWLLKKEHKDQAFRDKMAELVRNGQGKDA